MVSEILHLTAYGHKNVLADHKSTFEITKEKHLTTAGDCIIAVGADTGAIDIPRSFVEILKQKDATLKTTLKWDYGEVTIKSRGSPNLTLTHDTDLVYRKSDFICDRTIGINSDYAARDLPRDLVRYLQYEGRLEITLIVESDF